MIGLVRYGVVSVAALIADVATLRLLTEVAHLHYALAASAGFSLGLVVNYMLSRRAVFGATAAMSPREFLLFAAVGLFTLGMTLGVMGLLVENFQLHYMAAKAVAVAGSFLANYTLRKRFVFAAP